MSDYFRDLKSAYYFIRLFLHSDDNVIEYSQSEQFTIKCIMLTGHFNISAVRCMTNIGTNKTTTKKSISLF